MCKVADTAVRTDERLRLLVEQLVENYDHPEGCGFCGGKPHYASCYIGRFRSLLDGSAPAPQEAARVIEPHLMRFHAEDLPPRALVYRAADVEARLATPQEAEPPRKLTVEITTKRNMPGFAAYLAGSVKTGRVRMLLNIDALLWACVEGERGDFRRSVIDSLAHEFIHALEEHFGLLFDEQAVEAAIQKVRDGSGTTASAESPRPDVRVELRDKSVENLERLASDPAVRQANWDSYGALPLTDAAVAAARDFLRYAWSAVPSNSGGIQLERHDSSFDIEVSFTADGKPESVLATDATDKDTISDVRAELEAVVQKLEDNADWLIRGQVSSVGAARNIKGLNMRLAALAARLGER